MAPSGGAASGAPSGIAGASGLSTPRAVLAAGATGFGVMAAELTAVRLLAPHFGDSAYVWTNVIGVILAAMALGAALGGRLSAREQAHRWPRRLLLAGAGLLAAAPFVAGWCGGALGLGELPLDAAMPALIRGSFVVSALVFAPPMLLLAAVSPVLVVLLAQRGVKLGRAAGDLAAAGTLGSLLGTFLATHVLVPELGCRLSLVVAAVVLALAGVVAGPTRGMRAAAFAAVGVGITGALHSGPLRAPPPGVELLAERETPYQLLQVQRRVTPEDTRVTLVINEGLDSFHSMALEGSALTGGNYYDWHALAPLLAADGGELSEVRVASIGDAAGTLRQVYAAIHPGVPVDAVDIDGATMALGDEFWRAPKAAGRRYAMDGRQFVRHATERWHVLHVDAYAHQVYVPAHLASVEFFEDACARLVDGGVIACNVGALSLDDPVLGAVVGTMEQVFDDVAVLLVPRTRNALVVGRRGRAVDPSVLHPSRALEVDRAEALGPEDERAWRALLEHASEPERWHRLASAGPVLSDDRPVLDELLLDSYLDRADPARTVEAAGSRGLADVEQAAFEANQRGDWTGALAAVAEGQQASPFSRLQAGDARWNLRHLKSAAAEYRAALQGASDELRPVLEGRLQGLDQELLPVLAAERAAARLGWLSALAVAVGVGAALGLRRC
ncbi:MAG: fused MFS/spermidine synthase [Planctomycetota bacterium]